MDSHIQLMAWDADVADAARAEGISPTQFANDAVDFYIGCAAPDKDAPASREARWRLMKRWTDRAQRKVDGKEVD